MRIKYFLKNKARISAAAIKKAAVCGSFKKVGIQH
jgi:hypothetical protein